MPHLAVHLFFVFSQLEHVSQDGYPAAFSVFQNVKRCLHGSGICVVTVVHDHQLFGLDQFETSADGLHGFDPSRDLLRCKSIDPAHSRCRKGIVHHMDARNRDICGKSLLSKMDPAGGSLQSMTLQLVGIDIIFRIQSEKHRTYPVVLFYSAKLIIIPIQDDMAIRTDEIQHFRLRLQNPVPVSQELQMSGTDVGDHARVRLCNGGQAGHFSEMVDSHLQHRDLIFFPKTENGQRHTQLVVEIALGLQCPVFL